MTVTRTTIHEVVDPQRRLGRHVAHDERSRDYPAAVADVLVTTVHPLPPSLPLDQGDLGSCTGNAMAGLLGVHGVHVDEAIAVSLYSEATHLDHVRGVYPPSDTGSSGLAVARAAKLRNMCRGYTHAFGLNHALHSIVVNPVIIGINWYDSFDTPDGNAHIGISPNAGIRGGHEVLVYRLDVDAKVIGICNSWGPDYGDHGTVSLSWADFDRLLNEQGDVTTVTF